MEMEGLLATYVDATLKDSEHEDSLEEILSLIECGHTTVIEVVMKLEGALTGEDENWRVMPACDSILWPSILWCAFSAID